MRPSLLNLRLEHFIQWLGSGKFRTSFKLCRELGLPIKLLDVIENTIALRMTCESCWASFRKPIGVVFVQVHLMARLERSDTWIC